MKSLSKIILALSLFALGAQAGGMDSGGGFRIQKRGQWILLDLAFVPHFKDKCLTQSPSNIKMGVVGETMGYEKVELDKLPAHTEALKILKRWERNSPTLVARWKEALNNTVWRFSAFSVPTAHVAYDAPNSWKGIEAVAYYTSSLGVIVDSQKWNELCETSKSALILHEGLRHLQMTYDELRETKDLQNLIAKVVGSSPEENESLESEAWIKGNLFDFISAQRKNSEDYKNTETLLCELLSNSKERLEKILDNLDSEMLDLLSQIYKEKKSNIVITRKELLGKAQEWSCAGRYVELSSNEKEKINLILTLASNDNVISESSRAIREGLRRNSIEKFKLELASNDHSYIDATKDLSNVFVIAGEDILIDSLSGKENTSWWEMRKIRKQAAAVKKVMMNLNQERKTP